MKRLFLFLCLAAVSTLFLATPSASASVAKAGAPAAVTQSGAQTSTADAASAAATRDDPAATRLRMISYGLVGLALLILVMTAIFWRVTRPPMLLAGATAGAGAAAATGATARSAASAPGAAPTKIPAAVVLASPLTAAVPTWAEHADAPIAAPPSDATPDLDAPPPIAGQPLGAHPLVGNDTAWIIEPDSDAGLVAETPTPGDFPESVEASADEPIADLDSPVGAAAKLPDVVEGDLVQTDIVETAVAETDIAQNDAAELGAAEGDPAEPTPAADAPVVPAAPAETVSLISALAALPDIEPTVVRFDDPPVQRVKPRSAGAPGFDQAARQSVAVDEVVDVAQPAEAVVITSEPELETVPPRRVDDMALMASALSSLPQRELDFPPTGEFYDQDLDSGEPPGRDR